MNKQDFHQAVKAGQRVLVAMRGAPGTGKSTQVKEIIEKYGDKVRVHSTDDYHMVNGDYCYDASRAGYCHACNQAAASASMKEGKPIVIIDNTNITASQFLPYYEVGKQEGYRVRVEQAQGMQLHPRILAERTIHRVPLEAIEAMMKRFENETTFLRNLEALWVRKQTREQNTITG